MSKLVRIREAVDYCLSKNYKITLPGIRYVVKSHPEIFVKSKVGNYHPIIYLDELDYYISLYNEPDSEWISVNDASKEHGLGKNVFYYAFKKNKLGYELFGRGCGVAYMRRKDVTRFVEEYRANHKNRH